MSTPPAETWSATPIIDWLLHRGRQLHDPEKLLNELCSRVVRAGMPLNRVRVFIYTLHPQYFGFVLSWEDGETGIHHGEHHMLQSDTFKLSPMARIQQGERVIRRRLSQPDCRLDYPVLVDLKEEGFSDYIMVEMTFSNGTRNGVSLMSKAPGGFSDHDMAEVERLLQLFALIMENHANQGIASNLLDTYLGTISGARVLDGKIKRGDGDEIDAVIWFSDLRDSTPLAESLGSRRFLELLNDYFEATAGAVLAGGGEVLRFIGDASLAVFPVSHGAEDAVQSVCRAAVQAARNAAKRVTEVNAKRMEQALPAFNYGIGLHLGQVLYGNIGTPDRLEFSVIGAAANETARIEALSKLTGERVVVSETVTRQLQPDAGNPWRSLGRHALRGVGHEIEVFGLPEQ